MSICRHPKQSRVSHTYVNGQLWTRCTVCGHTWAPVAVLVLAGDHLQYEQYIKSDKINPCWTYFEGGSAETLGIHCSKCVIVGTFLHRTDSNEQVQLARLRLDHKAETWIDGYPDWRVSLARFDANGHLIVEDVHERLRCNKCKKIVSETYKYGFCSHCKAEENNVAWKGAKKIGNYNPLANTKTVPGPHPGTVRKEGEIWKLPKNSSPMWTEQWGYQGSSKTPYVISHRTENINGAMTEEGWACSCPNFTRHTPRTDCKHILNVKLKEGLGGVTKGKAKMASTDAKILAEFEAWKRDKAARTAGPATAGNAKLNLFGSTGRKFR